MSPPSRPAASPSPYPCRFRVMLYILEGEVRHEYGDGCKQALDNSAGDFIFIEPGIPHEVARQRTGGGFRRPLNGGRWDKIIPYER